MRAIIMVSALAASVAAWGQPVDPLPVKPDTTVDGAVVGFALGALPWLTMTAVDWQSHGRPPGPQAFGQLAITVGSGFAGALIGASVDRAKIAVHDPVWDGALKGALWPGPCPTWCRTASPAGATTKTGTRYPEGCRSRSSQPAEPGHWSGRSWMRDSRRPSSPFRAAPPCPFRGEHRTQQPMRAM